MITGHGRLAAGEPARTGEPGRADFWAGGEEDGEEDLPGDPACLLRRVCQECGSVADEDPPTTCPQCAAELPAG
jgi:rubrerythrin